jgi:hypothetical protein
VIPQEAALNERAVSFTKGCYVGQETVARLFYRGKPNRHLRGLRLGPGRPRRRAAPRRVASWARQQRRLRASAPIALALVRARLLCSRRFASMGEVRAEVLELPFPGA